MSAATLERQLCWLMHAATSKHPRMIRKSLRAGIAEDAKPAVAESIAENRLELNVQEVYARCRGVII